MNWETKLLSILGVLGHNLVQQDMDNNTGLLAQEKPNTSKLRKSGVSWVEKENSYPHKIIIERKAEGFGRSNQFWSEVVTVRLRTEQGIQVKHIHRDVISDIDYEKILKILSKYEKK